MKWVTACWIFFPSSYTKLIAPFSLISILGTCAFTEFTHPSLLPKLGGLALAVTLLYPVRLNNDGGSPPRALRQMADSSLKPSPWPRSPPLLYVCTCTPTFQSSSLFLAAPLIDTRKHVHTQCSREKMNHLDSAAVCHTRLHAAQQNICRPTENLRQKQISRHFSSDALCVSTDSNRRATLLR